MTSVGIIGFGNWPRQAYAPLLNELSDVPVVAVAARSDATRAIAKETFGGDLATFEDYGDLLADESIDAVLIALPNALHHGALAAAACSGKHVFFEPPVAEDREAAGHILNALAQSDRVIQADLELRCLPVVDAVSRLLQSGNLGQPRMAKIRLWCNWGYGGGPWFDEVQGQSFFLWLGCWYLDVLDVLFGEAALHASVVGGYASNGALMDHGWAALTYPEQRIGQFEFNLVATQDATIELYVACQEGEIQADLTTGAWRWRDEPGNEHCEDAPASTPAYGFEGMRESLADFFAAIRSGHPPRADLAVMRRVQHAAMLCAEAERARRPQ